MLLTTAIVALAVTFLVASDAAFTTDVTPNEVIIGLTDELTVTCNYTSVNISRVRPFSIILAKSNYPDQNFQDIASVFINSTPKSIQNDVSKFKVESDQKASYLKATWRFPKSTTAGFYRCSMVGFDGRSYFIEKAKANQVRATLPSNTEDIVIFSILDRLTSLEKKINTDVDVKVSELKNRVEVSRSSSLKAMFVNNFTYGNSRYYLSRTGVLRILTAEIACATYGGHLAEIKSMDEFTAIATFLKSDVQLQGVIVGLSDEGSEGHWFYTYTRRPANFTLWLPGQPNGGAAENCVVLHKPSGWKYVDVKCVDHGYSWQFLCEIPENLNYR